MTETLVLAAILVPCLIVAIVFHEVAHGWMALKLGDTTARDLGRLTLNPIRHVDPVGTLLVPGALAMFGGPIFGWAKPVPVNANRLDNPRYGMMAVAAAGPGTNILLALIGAIFIGISSGLAAQAGVILPTWVMTAGGAFILINVFLALFNLLPIPPFDGSHIVGGLLPRSFVPYWHKLQGIGMILLVVLIGITWAFPNVAIIQNTVLPPVMWLQARFFAIAAMIGGAIA